MAAADGLPADVLRAIRRSLPLVDYIRFPAVCSAWSSAARDQGKLPPPPRGRPWLFHLVGNTIYAFDCIGDIGAAKVYRIPLPDDLHDHEMLYSLGHCLLFEKRGTFSGIRLFNPFSSTQATRLPPSATLVSPQPPCWTDPYWYHGIHVHTVVTDTDGRIAFAIHSGGIAYTRLDCNRDDSDDVGRWTDLKHLIPDDCCYFTTVILYKAGLFCAVDDTGNKVVAFDFSGAPAVRLVDMTFNLPPNDYSNTSGRVDWSCYQSSRLINSGTSLFLVRWRTILKRAGVKKRREMDVYRLDDHDARANRSKQWVPVRSLGDLSFFLGWNESISMSTRDFPELKSNRVYLHSDSDLHLAGDYISSVRVFIFGRGFHFDDDTDAETALGHHLVYNLEDESWGVFYDEIRTDCPPPLIWMIPRP